MNSRLEFINFIYSKSQSSFELSVLLESEPIKYFGLHIAIWYPFIWFSVFLLKIPWRLAFRTNSWLFIDGYMQSLCSVISHEKFNYYWANVIELFDFVSCILKLTPFLHEPESNRMFYLLWANSLMKWLISSPMNQWDKMNKFLEAAFRCSSLRFSWMRKCSFLFCRGKKLGKYKMRGEAGHSTESRLCCVLIKARSSYILTGRMTCI